MRFNSVALSATHSSTIAAWVNAFNNNDTGGGEVSVTLLGGMDGLFYEELKQTRYPKMYDAEMTLRTLAYHAEYAIPSERLEWNKSQNPPSGSSGIHLRGKVPQMLDGF